jgi:hypothetical protein
MRVARVSYATSGEGRLVRRLALIALCLVTLAMLAACVGGFSYDNLMYPDARFNRGDQ